MSWRQLRNSLGVAGVTLAGLALFVLMGVPASLAAPQAAARSAGPSAAPYEVWVNTGGGAYSDRAGNLWAADQAYSPAAGWGFVGGQAYTTTVGWDIVGTLDDPLYRSVRNWTGVNSGQPVTGSYLFDVPPGQYEVDLRFADLAMVSHTWGFRYFDVEIEGVTYLCRMDIISAAGKYATYDWTFPVTVTDGQLTINFISHPGEPEKGGVNQAMVNGIHVRELQGYTPPTYAAYPRLGAGLHSGFGQIDDYDVASLHFGWYASWSTRRNTPHPNGMEYVQLVQVDRFHYEMPTPITYWKSLSETVLANPGSTWIIGNEMEASFQGNRSPYEYAKLYHDVGTFIKDKDPTARLAVGGVVMVSQARLWWLDKVLQTYPISYSVAMPVDVWTVHEQILNESAAQPNSGAGWPVGVPTNLSGEFHAWQCFDTLSGGNADYNAFVADINTFRQWMKERGFRDTPLWISEYGVLFPPSMGCTEKIVGDYLQRTMEWLNTASDAAKGMPSDENRLVQRWLWYSLNDEPYNANTRTGFSGAMFYYGCPAFPGAMTGVGRAYRDWVNAITPPGPTATPTSTPTPTNSPTPTATRTPLGPGQTALDGQVRLQGRPAPPDTSWQVPLTVTVFPPGQATPVYEMSATSDGIGQFAVTGIITGAYDIRVKNPQTLANKKLGVPIAEGSNPADFGLLLGGDANNDNVVGIADASLLGSSYGLAQGQTGYVAAADFNGNHIVDLGDASLLGSNYAAAGDRVAGALHLASDAVIASPGLAGTVNIIAGSASTVVGRSFSIAVTIQAGSQEVDAASVEVQFDTAMLTANSITMGTALGSTLDQSIVGNVVNCAQYKPGAPFPSGSFTLCTINFTAKSTPGATPLTFINIGSPTGTDVLRSGVSVRDKATDGSVTISNPTPTRTPTRTPTLCVGCPTPTATPPGAPYDRRLNAGGGQYTDGQGNTWAADQAYVEGGETWGYVQGASYSVGNDIAGTTDDPLYQTERYNLSQYIFDLPSGIYSVTLKFAELYATTGGQRVFDVTAEGQAVLVNLDVFQQAGGRFIAWDYAFPVAVSDGHLNVQFVTKTSASAKVNAIRVVSQGAGQTPTPTATAPGAPTATFTATPSRTATTVSRDPYEPNNSFGQAYGIQPGPDYQGYVDGPDDVDYFAFSVDTADSYIWASLTGLPADYDLFLHDSQQRLLAASASGGTSDEYILDYGVGSATGVYYLRVVGYGHAFNADTPYHLHLALHPATPTATATRTATGTPTRTATPSATRTSTPQDQYEPNNTFDQAYQILSGATYLAYLDYADDNDYFRLSVPGAGSQVAVSLINLPADYDLYLADPARNTVSWSRYGGTASEYIIYNTTGAGTFYIRVAGYEHAYDAVHPYRLLAQVFAPNPSTTPALPQDLPVHQLYLPILTQ